MKRILILVVVFLLASQLMACSQSSRHVPTDGVWSNSDLKVTIDFRKPRQRYNASVMVDGITIYCVAGNDKGSNLIVVLSQVEVDNICHVGEVMFEFECIRLTEDLLTVLDEAGKEYVFKRERVSRGRFS